MERVLILATDLLHAIDREAFARQVLRFEPDPWQADVLRSDARRMLLNCSRQSGKSATAAVLAVHEALYNPGSLTLLVSPSQRQSSELFRTTSTLLHELEHMPKLPEDNRLSCTLENRSRIVSLPSSEATVRGFSGAALIVEDEAARVPDELHKAIRPMLATSGGRLVLMSTPFGQRGHFWELWDHGGPQWQRIKITAYDCPRIPKDFLEEERAALGDLWFQSEYLCEFVDTVNQVFSTELVRRALSRDVTPLFGG